MTSMTIGVDDRFGARHGDRAHAERRGARRGRWRRLPRARAALGGPGLHPGAPAFLFTHLHVREDAMVLYGFPTRDERDTFEALIGATGVGSEARARDPVGARARRVAALPRRGRPRRAHARSRRRQAHRAAAARRAEDAVSKCPTSTSRRCPACPSGARAEVREALTGLGYSTDEVRDALGQLVDEANGEGEDVRRPRCATRCRLLAGAPMRDELLQPGGRSGRGRRGDDAAAAPPRRVRRPAAPARAPRDHADRGAPARAGRRPCAVRRAARSRQDQLAGIIATEMGARFQPTSGPALERAGDLAAILTNLDDGDVLFIDEVHRLPRPVEEVLYPAMEDFQLDIVIGKGPSARTIRLDLPRFTLVGATTRTGLITGPLRDRFGFVARLDYYVARRPHRDPGPRRADPRRRPRRRRAHARSRDDRAARRASRTGCSSGCATTRRCAPTAASTSDRRATRSHCSRSTSAASTRSTAPILTALCRTFAGRRGRPRHARGRGGRGARDRRRRVRAVPAPVRAARAHAARPGRDTRGVRAPRLARSGATGRGSGPVLSQPSHAPNCTRERAMSDLVATKSVTASRT